MKNDRVRCCVPFCQRTAPPVRKDGQAVDEFICAEHWRAADAELRRRYNRERKRLRPLLAQPVDGYTPDQRHELLAAWRWLVTMWTEVKKQAIEKALGI